ncbi:tetracycline resistance ribosomal protection protein Otr(A) [Streptomyces sp. NPDC051940]|uniref:tetracycline resistance ribosomal protection protein Otr(A) n=1 Tax=Streptomyces sp. NPDC051940 TaxID=3155675 RepID=UPI00343D4BD0
MHPSRPRTTLNLGILAHVDAGKTSLTERLLYDGGAIDRLGSVDAGDTRTDTGELERQRGITIRTAVAPFTIGDVQVNLIDTPGHHDFIAEVERALGVLDGAVLVLSAVEGVQAQTRVLMRTLRRLRLPTLLFVNKIDRAGARDAELLADIRRLLAPHVLPLTAPSAPGTPRAGVVRLDPDPEVLAEADDAVLARYVDGPPPTPGQLTRALARRTADGSLHPLYVGSALGGQGVAELMEGIVRWIPPRSGSRAADRGPAPRGVVFSVNRTSGGARTAYLRLFEGEVRARQPLEFRRRQADGSVETLAGRPTSVDVVGSGTVLTAGDIAAVRGVPGVRVGDVLGEDPGTGGLFTPPGLETVVRAKDPEQAGRLRAALLALAEQDPLIHARPAAGGHTSVLLYGEVQQEIIEATLAAEYGIAADFEPPRTVCLERPAGTGSHVREVERRGPADPFATVGLRVEPGPRGSGAVFRYETELGALPRAFHQAVEDSVYEALHTGPHGWAVTDVRVTMIRSGFVAPVSTAGDFRTLTPLVLAEALRRAGTRVYEPYLAFEAEVPADALAAVVAGLSGLGAEVRETAPGHGAWLVAGEVPARAARECGTRLPGWTRGEGVWTSRPAADRPAAGRPVRVTARRG